MSFPPNNQFEGILRVWNSYRIPKIELSSSNPTKEQFNLSQIFQYDSMEDDYFAHFASKGNENTKPYIQVHFINNKLILTNYSILSHDTNLSIHSWVVKGCNDGMNWNIVHQMNNTTDLYYSANKTYEIDGIYPPYSYYILQMTEPILNGEKVDWTMRVRHLELFGDLVINNPVTCGNKITTIYSAFLISLVMIYL